MEIINQLEGRIEVDFLASENIALSYMPFNFSKLTKKSKIYPQFSN